MSQVSADRPEKPEKLAQPPAVTRPGKPMRADARRNYERLIAEAAVAFAEHGERASLDDIAKRAGVGSGTLYRHFPTRRDLMEAVYLDTVHAMAERADELAARYPPGQALTEWLVALGEETAKIRGLKALLSSAATEDNSVLTACADAMRGAVRRLVEAAQQEGTVRADIEPVDVLRLAHGVSTASELGDQKGRLIRRYLQVLVEGLGAATPPKSHGQP